MTRAEELLVHYAAFIGGVEGIMLRVEAGQDTAEQAVAALRSLLGEFHAAEAGDQR